MLLTVNAGGNGFLGVTLGVGGRERSRGAVLVGSSRHLPFFSLLPPEGCEPGVKTLRQHLVFVVLLPML